MSTQFQVWSYIQVLLNRELESIGSLHDPNYLTIAGDIIDPRTGTLANNTTLDLWTASSEPATADFDLFVLVSDQNLLVELTCDKDNNNGTELFIVTCYGSGTAGKYGIPFILAGDDSEANYTADFAAGTADVIDRIRIRNESGSTANFKAWIAT